MRDFKEEIEEIRARIRGEVPPVPDDLNLPIPSVFFRDPDDEDGPPVVLSTPVHGPTSPADEIMFDPSPPGDRSNGEIAEDDTGNGEGVDEDITGNGEQKKSTKIKPNVPLCQFHSYRPSVQREATKHDLEV